MCSPPSPEPPRGGPTPVFFETWSGGLINLKERNLGKPKFINMKGLLTVGGDYGVCIPPPDRKLETVMQA